MTEMSHAQILCTPPRLQHFKSIVSTEKKAYQYIIDVEVRRPQLSNLFESERGFEVPAFVTSLKRSGIPHIRDLALVTW